MAILIFRATYTLDRRFYLYEYVLRHKEGLVDSNTSIEQIAPLSRRCQGKFDL